MTSPLESLPFSMRIVSLDYYMAPPLPGMDVCYNSYLDRNILEVPVIRIFGPTLAGQKVCMHIHGVLPYLYIPCSGVSLHNNQEGHAYTLLVSRSLEDALGGSSLKKQHIHSCSLVKAKKFYGYHSSDELFAKIFLYYPHEVDRAARLLLADHNLYGMGVLHLLKVKFRNPIPDHCITGNICGEVGDEIENGACDVSKTEVISNAENFRGLSLWLSSTVPTDWTWSSSSADSVNAIIERQSKCELEGDAHIEDVINRQFVMHTSTSQTQEGEKMVQSLIPIWEEHMKMGLNEATMPSDFSRPAPEVVLKTFLHETDTEKAFIDLYGRAYSGLSSQEKHTEDDNFVHAIKSLSDAVLSPLSTMLEGGLSSMDDEIPSGQACRLTPMPTLGKSTVKSLDNEALELLRWFSSSQAGGDTCMMESMFEESILRTLLPGTSIERILEDACRLYETESQQECKDILDSVGASGRSLDNSLLEERNAHIVGFSVENAARGTIDGANKNEGDDLLYPSGDHKGHFCVDYVENEASSVSSREVVDSNYSAAMSPDYVTTANFCKQILSACSFRKRCSQVDSSHFKIRNAKKAGLETDTQSTVVPAKFGFAQRPHVHHSMNENPLRLSEIENKIVKERTNIDPEENTQDKIQTLTTEMLMACPVRQMPELSGSKKCQKDTISGADLSGFSVDEDQRKSLECFPLKLNRAAPHSICKENDTMSCLWFGDRQDHSVMNCPDDALAPDYFCCKRRMHAIPLFFEPTSLTENVWSKGCDGMGQVLTCRKDHWGVPAYYTNDGFFFYLLTPVFSPPSVDSVHQWLMKAHSGAHAGDVDQIDQLVQDDVSKPSQSIPQHTLIGRGQERETDLFLSKSLTPVANKIATHGESCPEKVLDASQLSGPEKYSRLTPLSQTGFRDSATVDTCHCLTLMSVEVMAESRGDLRPDPRHDAVNIIALAIQQDNNPIHGVYLLVRENSHCRNIHGVPFCEVLSFSDEKRLFSQFEALVCSLDPDILIGWEIQCESLGFLAERAAYIGIRLLKALSRIVVVSLPTSAESGMLESDMSSPSDACLPDIVCLDDPIIANEWGRTHTSGLHIGGRIVLNLWRIMHAELKLNMYTLESVSEAVLQRKVPSIPSKTLSLWFLSATKPSRFRCMEYVMQRAKLNLEILSQLDLVNRTAELARIYGIDFFSVLSRGSQYRVESMYLRLAHMQNYVAISPGPQQVALQPAMECLPLVMEPESGFYTDPVIVLDFQSLYPSMILAYNLCYSTCLGKVAPKVNQLGVASYEPKLPCFVALKDQIFVTPNNVMFVNPKVRKGVLPCLLDEILSTRIMVKQAIKKLGPSQKILQRIFNARQLALKLIANVTYGYTAAGFSGRMPCSELADSIVQCGRSTLESAICFVNSHVKWNAKVLYGDTDSLFVLLRGRSVNEALIIGQEIASEITSQNPSPVVLKMEKVYCPCVLLTKKRYVGYSYEDIDQVNPVFDAKGIETVRRDTCGAVAKIMEQSLRILFETRAISKVKEYVQRQFRRILCGKTSLQDFVFWKEVRLGMYRDWLPPAAIVACKAMKADPRAEPRYAERVPYVVIYGEPGARLYDMVVDPLHVLNIHSPYRLNDLYYIHKQIIPALQRVFQLLGADVGKWFMGMPRPSRAIAGPQISSSSLGSIYSTEDLPQGCKSSYSLKSRIDHYYLSKHCFVCGRLLEHSGYLCRECCRNGPLAVTALVSKTSRLEKNIHHLVALCEHCGGADWVAESGVKCNSLACSILFERRKVQKELYALSAVAADAGLFPRCMPEWF